MDRFSDKCFGCGHLFKDHSNYTSDGHRSRLQICRLCSCRSFIAYSTEFIRVACRVLRSKDQDAVRRLEALMARWSYLAKLDSSQEKTFNLCISDLKSLFMELQNGRREMRKMRKQLRINT